MPLHLKRLIGLFGAFILLFLLFHRILKPETFGKLGHYRALAITENADKPPQYAGAIGCSTCHDSIRAAKAGGFHRQLTCEVCHGPGMKHVLYAGKFSQTVLPDSLVLKKPGSRKDCLLCHQFMAARTKIKYDTIDNTQVKQVDSLKHFYFSKKTNTVRQCILCHNPHQP